MKACLRCGQPVQRRVMLTAKYCSAECRQQSAKEAYNRRHRNDGQAKEKEGCASGEIQKQPRPSSSYGRAGGMRSEMLIPACDCLECGKELDAATCFEGTEPAPGDITICVYCGHIMAFGETGTLRPLNDREITDVAGDPHILAAMRARAAYWCAMREKEQ